MSMEAFSFALNSLSVGMESTLTGSTTVPASTNLPRSFEKAQTSLVQVPVNASGQKASSTFFPFSADKVTSDPLVDGSVQSGAGEPMVGSDMITSRCRTDVRRQPS